jgi:hypothetical protein
MKKMTGADLQGLATAQSTVMMSPANKNIAPVPRPSASRVGNRASMNGFEKPPLSTAAHNQMTPDPKR